MSLRVIDRQLFVTDDGRTICALGANAYVVPDPELPRLIRVRSRFKAAGGGLSFAALAAMIVMNLNVNLSFILWFVVSAIVAIVCSQLLRTWTRDHCLALSDQSILDEIRQLRQTPRGSRWAAFGSIAAYLVLFSFRASGAAGGWIGAVVLLVAVVLNGIQVAAAQAQHADFEARISSSVTR